MQPNGAFGNYRDLLEEVTLSPVMGFYLSMFRNQKPDPVRNIRPDENYAREVMQLFSIGLVELNLDGTPVLVNGETVPTYDQQTISGFAHVFTGWNFANCAPPQQWQRCPPGPVANPEPGWDDYIMLPMAAWENYHASDFDKQLLDYPGVALAAGMLLAGGTAQSDLDAALDNIFQHPNLGPFVVKHLIKRLITSNPSPAYVGRVAAVVNNNGIGVRGDLGMRRQIFFVSLGGFDNHDAQLADQSANLAELDGALAAFHAASVEMGVAQSVTSFTASEFGRTTSINGDGTDHGWGSHHMILGGAVNGGQMYGAMPNLAPQSPDDANRGQIIPTTAVDQYAATLSRWYGVPESEIATVFPNVGRFATSDLGFMGS